MTHTHVQDSTEITGADRDQLADLCCSVAADRIVITHGTDTMIETAKSLAQNARLLTTRKTIVLTGLFSHTYHVSVCV